VHRIGRTGRAGRQGTSLTLVSRSDRKYVEAIEKLIGNKIEWLGATIDELPAPETVETPRRHQQERKRAGRPAARAEERHRPSDSPRSVEPSAPRPTAQRRQRDDEDDRPVKGLGDHVPSFLLRPVRITKS